VSLYDIEGSEVAPFVDLIEEADGLLFGSPTINGDAVKPVWDMLSSLTLVNVKGKLGAAFGSYGWSGEAVPMVEDRLRRLKLRVPVPGVRARLIPTDDELAECRELGRQTALHLVGRAEARVIDMASLA
jgi:flavorubredoxin